VGRTGNRYRTAEHQSSDGFAATSAACRSVRESLTGIHRQTLLRRCIFVGAVSLLNRLPFRKAFIMASKDRQKFPDIFFLAQGSRAT
jgi:hypothetical protein